MTLSAYNRRQNNLPDLRATKDAPDQREARREACSKRRMWQDDGEELIPVSLLRYCEWDY